MKSYLLLTLLCLTAVMGCANPKADSNASQSDKIEVVVTTGQVADLVRRLGGEHFEISVMMGPGVDPHLYEPLPSDMIKIDKADVIVYSGLHLEGKLTEVLEGLAGGKDSKGKSVVAVTQGLIDSHDERLLHPEEFENLHDPHVWHDVSIWSDCAEYLAKQLTEIDPSHADEYEANLVKLQNEFAGLDSWCKEQFSSVPEESRIMVTAHDAFAYFSKAYGLESFGLKGISTEDEVDLGQMQEVAKIIIERKIPCVFIESAVPRRIVEALVEECQAQGHTVTIGGELYADALGPMDSEASDYVGMIQTNVETIVMGLIGVSPEGEDTKDD